MTSSSPLDESSEPRPSPESTAALGFGAGVVLRGAGFGAAMEVELVEASAAPPPGPLATTTAASWVRQALRMLSTNVAHSGWSDHFAPLTASASPT